MSKKDFFMTRIIIRTRWSGLHRWSDAPEEVKFLGSFHRHEFHIELEIEVHHNDRELEFFIVKNRLNKHLLQWPEQSDRSCEMMARDIIEWTRKEFPHAKYRTINCSVFEDGENGAKVYS